MLSLGFASLSYAPTTVPAGGLASKPVMSPEKFKVFVDSDKADATMTKPVKMPSGKGPS